MAVNGLIIVGSQDGDEGKGKLVDLYAEDADVVFRAQGGPNAGHTIEVGGFRVALHGIPSGVYNPKTKLYIGSGCLINPVKLIPEKAEVEHIGRKIFGDFSLDGRFRISSLTSIIQPAHILEDKITGAKIGSTGNGIGPTYAARCLRHDGIKQLDLRFGYVLEDQKEAKECMEYALEKVIERFGYGFINREYQQFLGESGQNMINECLEKTLELEPFLESNRLWLTKQAQAGARIVGEGAQATGICNLYGISPYNTASQTGVDATFAGGDLSSKYRGKVIGVAKALTTRVGNGPFIGEFGGIRSEHYCNEERGNAHRKAVEVATHPDPMALLTSEDDFEVGIGFRMLTNNYGASTGRPRRTGILDLVRLNEVVARHGIDTLALNAVDVLHLYQHTRFPGIPVITGYKILGKKIDFIPTTEKKARAIEPVIEFLPHIPDIQTCRTKSDLPTEVHQLITFVEEKVGCPLEGIGVGPNRNEYVPLK